MFLFDVCSIIYQYDLKSNWVFIITLEKIIDDDGLPPRCVSGEGFAPPLGCVGPDDYYRFLDILGSPNHAEYEQETAWAEGMRAEGNWQMDKVLAGADFSADSVNEKIREMLSNTAKN